MSPESLLAALFPEGHAAAVDGERILGEGRSRGRSISVVGTTEGAHIGVDLALGLARAVLDVAHHHPRRPILLLVHNRGQRLARRDELLGAHRYLAHLAECLYVARRRGHPVLSLVWGEAVSGGFLAHGMMADRIFALAGAEVRVMDLDAMARITRLPRERLERLAAERPVLGSGADAYQRIGVIEAIWAGDLAEALADALADPDPPRDRRDLGRERGGRRLADPVSRRVREG